MNVMRHFLLVAAYVHYSSLLQPLVHLPALLQHPVLNVHFLVGVARERHIHSCQDALLKPALPFHLIQEIRQEMLISIE
ncbi:hypothetical protein D3C77_637310 [compost metagenome]